MCIYIRTIPCSQIHADNSKDKRQCYPEKKTIRVSTMELLVNMLKETLHPSSEVSLFFGGIYFSIS